MGGADHWAWSGGDRRLRPPLRQNQEEFHPRRLRLHAHAQWPKRDARGLLPAGNDRAWVERGGGAFFLTYDRAFWGLDTTLLHGLDVLDTSVRILDQSRIGAVLVGEPDALCGGPPVEAMLMQNANSATVAPDTGKVLRGLGRDDL